MNIFYKKSWLFLCTALFCSAAFAQQDWPKSITGSNGELIKIYQPQVESYAGSSLKSRSAVSVIPPGKSDPVFGAFWWEANVSDNGNSVAVQSVSINNIKFPDGVDDNETADIKSKLESSIPQMNISIAKDELQTSLNNTQQQSKQSAAFNNNPPKVIYTTKPSMLVLIDGQPKLQNNSTYGVDVVVNSPYTIVKNNDGRYYLYGGKVWYNASSVTGPYSYSANVPDNLHQIETAVKNNENSSNNNNTSDNNATDNSVTTDNGVVPEIIVSTEPAELIQSDGEANFAPVENTNLLYVKNSSNDIFMDVNSQQYYVLLSGRWYRAPSLKSQWQFIGADKLPGDFAKIPAGSPKDNVLASVAGTDEANDAVTNAAIPQTAKVDRRTATTTVNYDGDPEFDNISGTRLQYAVNASATVLKLDGMYYAIDNGVWYQGNSANGPWQVSTSRPADVDNIPPSSPAYNSKYVYVYDVTPDYVYTGYTPGYLNAYVYGPTMVYGTGYYYRPWFRHRYFARPYTWGFNMSYTPWYGWGFGYGWGYDWFDIGFGFNSWWGGGYRYGGWWGPSVYRPCYAFGAHYGRSYGYYGFNGGYAYRNSARININYNNNIYNGRRNVTSYNNRSFVNNNRYNFNNRGGAYGNRDGGGRFGNNGGNRMNNGGDNNRFNNNNRGGGFGNRDGANNNNGRFNNQNNQNNAGNNGRGFNNNNNATPRGNDGNGFGRNRDFNQNNNNNAGNQPPRAQRDFSTPQRSYGGNNGNGGGFSRPQQQGSVDRPQRSAAPGFDRGGGGGSRPSFGGGGSGGGGSRPSFGGGGGGGGRSSGGGGGGGGRGGGGRRG